MAPPHAPISRRIVYYPPFGSQVDLNEQYFRSAWYLRPFADRTVVFPVEPYLVTPPAIAPRHLDPDVVATIDQEAGPPSRFVPTTPEHVDFELSSADAVMLWDRPSQPELLARMARLGVRPPVWKVDRDRDQYEGSFYLRATADDPELRDVHLAEARGHLERIIDRLAGGRIYVLCTGPSVATVADHDFSDGTVIVCNSLVKNDAMLERLKPSLVVATDPIFHAGVSSYAATFRTHLRKVMATHGASFATLFRDYAVMRSWANESEAARITGVPIDWDLESPNLDLRAHPAVRVTSNVLTLLMLPIAATVGTELILAGCDGRPLEEDDYYWTHDPASQFVDELATIRYVHPAFFNVEFQDYYLTHCDTLAAMIAAAEKTGLTVGSLTPSHIPALRERQLDPSARLP